MVVNPFIPEILENIFDHIHTSKALLQCLLVSREWYACAIRHLYYEANLQPNSLPLFQSTISSSTLGGTVTRLVISRKDPQNDIKSSVFIDVAHRCPNLKILTLKRCQGLSNHDLLAALEVCGRNLIRLQLTECLDIAPENLSLIATKCPNLIHLVLTKINPNMIHSMLVVRSPDPNALISPDTLNWVAKSLPHLKRLVLNDCCIWVNDAVIRQAICRLPELRNLGLAACRYMTNEGMRAIGASLKYLEEIELSGNFQLTDEGILALVHGCPSIKKLRCSVPLTMETLRIVAASLPALRRLQLGSEHVQVGVLKEWMPRVKVSFCRLPIPML
ncbi:hypothetical protein BC936DRAFT_141866 [Jimgerdemannia flammicorona]|uniref:F-box domain-containing protein n=1 Tax=Jimgerdemannia flammicorona TaxID=994334 RepID=A0A433DFT5_9FUNG|nr:hypothetical protein BC936DRAFT_141866 [Jimgerdemannia flammicorona]